MKGFVLILITVLSIALSGCSSGNARETFETAQFEELQRNYAHAKELYREILEKYPESEFAAKASERLKALAQEE